MRAASGRVQDRAKNVWGRDMLIGDYVSRHATVAQTDSLGSYYLGYFCRLGLDPEAATVDVGCGWGFGAAYFKGRYTGIDLSEDKIRHASQRYPGGEFLQRDILQVQGEALPSFDQVIVFTVIDEIDQKEEALRAIHALGSSQAQFFVEVRNSDFFVRRAVRGLGLERLRRARNAMQGKRETDLPGADYVRLFHAAGFEIARVYKARRPLHSSSSWQLFKKLVYRAVDALVPTNASFMTGFVLRKGLPLRGEGA